MTLWWIGNAILALVIFPVVLVLLNRVLAPIERIRAASEDILANGVTLTKELENVPALLAETDETVHQVAVGAVRYAGTAGKLLG
jgi:integral membrane sensor domain MASE1